MSRRNLPPLAALRAFDAAARHGSFTLASEELGLTQAAVSYHIKILEERLGRQLFERSSKGVRLTETGRQFAVDVIAAMDALSEAYSSTAGFARQTLSINAIPTFATKYLTTAIQAFKRRYPKIDVRLEISENYVPADSIEADVSIRLGKGKWPGMGKKFLFQANFTPMASPDLVKSASRLSRPSDICRLPCLSPGDPRWQVWYDAAGVEDRRQIPDRSLHYGTQVIEAQAAAEGHGVAMLTPAFFSRELESGVLVQPFDILGNDGNGYWLLYPKSLSGTEKIRAFRTWILRDTELLR